LDIKWKNKLSILAWLALFTYGISGVLAVLFDSNDYKNKNYFNTTQFEVHINKLIHYIYAFEISYQTKDELKNSIDVTKEEIEKYRITYGELSEKIRNIEQEYEFQIKGAQNAGNQTTANLLIKKRDKEIEEVTKIFESDEYVKEKILEEKLERVDAYFKELENHRPEYEQYKNTFKYYFINPNTREVYTNLTTEESRSIDEFFNNKHMHFIISYPSSNLSSIKFDDYPLVMGDFIEIENLLRTDINALEGKIGISRNIPSSNFIMREYHTFNIQKTVFWAYSFGAFIALLISVIVEKKGNYLRRVQPQKLQDLYNKIPIDVVFLLFTITLIITLELFFDYPYLNYSYNVFGIIEGILSHILTITVIFWLLIVQGFYLYSRVNNFSSIQQNWRFSLTARFINMIKMAFLNRKVGTKVFLILAIVFFFGVLSVLILVEGEFIVIYLPLLFLVVIPMFIMIVKRIGYFNKIINHTQALANGDLETDLEIKGKSLLAKLAEDINKLKYGVKTSQKAQAKSERLKTELITNVSHDLRTPLTSILTYVDLLKNSELTEDERNSYIEIIDRKSKRLKVLIDDLFEASKMASGNIELVKGKVDIVQLLQQSLAEYNEMIKKSSIQFRILTPDQPVYAFVDGQKLWRVFDNLISNILKYSLANSRAYIKVKEENNQVIITFKNISEYELKDNVDELFERFKRGDKSRHTEGSGLGLAIAKSIIDLHGGSLDIHVDGDLFKVTVKLALFDHN